MPDLSQFALLLADLADRLHGDPGALGECETTLRELVELSRQRSATIRLRDGALSVDGATVAGDPPSTEVLIGRMEIHGVAEIQIAHDAPAFDLMDVARALAGNGAPRATGLDLQQRLRQTGVTGVAVVGIEQERVADSRRSARIADVLNVTSGTPVAPAARGIAVSVKAPDDVAAAPASDPAIPLDAVLKRFGKKAPPNANLIEIATAVVEGVREGAETGRAEDALEGIMVLLKVEEALPEDELRRHYTLAMSRVFSAQVLRSLSSLLLDPLYNRDLTRIMQRAGESGTEQLLSRLTEAPTFAERRALLGALRSMKHGSDILVSMLSHPQWYVVRNVADLVGELRIEEGVEALAKASEHPDTRVRKSAAAALAKIATPAAARHLRKALRDNDTSVRLEVARAMAGKGLAGLAMSLVQVLETEPDEGVRLELLRALGRIGSTDAVRALKKAAEPGGMIVGRRGSAPRLAAIEGLALAGGAEALATLRELGEDRDKEVRDAARKALGKAARISEA